MEALAVAARLAQFLGAALIFGWPLLHLYAFAGPPAPRAPLRAITVAGAVLVLAGGLAALSAQAAAMTGALEAAVDPSVWTTVLTGTTYGQGLLVRLVLAGCVLAMAAAAPRSRISWIALTGLGALVAASFAWTGHAAGGEGAAGAVHKIADVGHLLAAAVWLGSLPALATLVATGLRTDSQAQAAAASRGLASFSGVGLGLVAVLILTGLVNSWMIVDLPRLADLPHSPYGQVLLVKLTLFAGMLGLAAANRYALAPRLEAAIRNGGFAHEALRALRLSLGAEAALGILVLVAVSLLGVLPPPTDL